MTGGGHGGPAAQPCLFLLFPRGERPTAVDVRAALLQSNAAQVSYDPADRERAAVANDWLELLADGLTFDLLGLAPGEGLSPPEPRHRLGLSAQALGDCEAIGIAPGPHLAGAANALPVVRTMLGIAATLSSHWRTLTGLLWRPSACATRRDIFLELTEGWLGGGPFPVLSLIGVVEGEGGALASEGLAFFTGQEVALDPGFDIDRTAATRTIVRLVDWLVEQRPLREPVTLALDNGERWRLDPRGTRIQVSAD